MKKVVLPTCPDTVLINSIDPNLKHYGYATEDGTIAKLYRCEDGRGYRFEYISGLISVTASTIHPTAKKAIESIVKRDNEKNTPVYEFDNVVEFYVWAANISESRSFGKRFQGDG